jgi:hypothetical protein
MPRLEAIAGRTEAGWVSLLVNLVPVGEFGW